MKSLILILTSVISLSSLSNIPKERRLKKLSLHIKGEIPKLSEYEELAEIKESELDNFFKSKTTEYLVSPHHVEKMSFRLNQLFRLGLIEFVNDFNDSEHNSLSYLFKEMVSYNLSWDTLLTGKKYKMFTAMKSFGFVDQSDFGFFGALLPSQSDYPREFRGITNNSKILIETKEDEFGNSTPIPFERTHDFGDDERIAGSLTTSRFFNRYVNTSVNKNRKRAAAVFRIFLCDDMEAAITDSSDRTDYILDFVFPDTAGMSSRDVGNINLAESAHGQRPDCMACHYKLDPMGKTFGGSGFSLAPKAFKGALTYTTKDGQKVNIPTHGIGALGKAITEQKDYKACQTEHFWKWFIGEDKYLSPEVHDELIQKYDEFDGKVNDFIHYLVNREEFYNNTILTEEAKLAFKAKGILKNCNQCHKEEGIPSFSDWPIESDGRDMKKWLGKISKSLGLTGRRRTMPPKSHMWQPTQEDLNYIQNWIQTGAPNELGQRQIP